MDKNMLQKLWCWPEELKLTTNQLNKLPLAVDRDGNTVINWAASTGSTELLEKLWAVCKEMQLIPDELSKMLVAVWHKGAAEGYLEIMERQWLLVGEVQLNIHEIKRRLLLGQNNNLGKESLLI
jgi:Fe-S cluster biosynthesis and repair protein YggX